MALPTEQLHIEHTSVVCDVQILSVACVLVVFISVSYTRVSKFESSFLIKICQ